MKSISPANIRWVGIIGIVSLCLLSRLPQLTSPYFHADYNGDECVLGLMAKHMAEAKEFPFYFWGQHYGFCWIEAGTVALAIKFFGIGLFSLKVPMLILWTLGCVFFYCAVCRWTAKFYGFWVTALLIFSPAWLGWSMRARGGYITAFLLSTIILFLMSHNRLNTITLAGMGILSGFIFYAGPIYLLGLLPLLIYAVSSQKIWKRFFICIAGFIGIFILGKLMALLQTNSNFWNPTWFRPDPWHVYIATFNKRVFGVLNQDAGNGWAAVTLSNGWGLVMLIGAMTNILGLFIKRVGALSIPFFIGVILTAACTYFINCDDQWRYLLSLSVFLILWFGIQGFEWMKGNTAIKALLGLFMAVFILLGVLAAWNYKDSYREPTDQVPEMQKIARMIQFLKSSGIKYAYSLDDDLSWKLIYFSDEQILSRWMNRRGRQPEYISAVDRAYLDGKKVAVIGNMLDEVAAYLIIENEGSPIIVADPYFVYPSPTPKLIFDQLKFQLEKPSNL